jgi:hypothetical protein
MMHTWHAVLKLFCFHPTCDQCSDQPIQTMTAAATAQGLRRMRRLRFDNSKLGTALIARSSSAEEVAARQSEIFFLHQMPSSKFPNISQCECCEFEKMRDANHDNFPIFPMLIC